MSLFSTKTDADRAFGRPAKLSYLFVYCDRWLFGRKKLTDGGQASFEAENEE
jgi:hypothetical protein